VNEFLQQLRSFYEGLDPTRRRVMGVVLLLAAAFILGVGVWASQPQYITLTRFANGDDMVAMSQALSRAGISYRVGSDGLSLEVSTTDEIAARKAISAEGIVVGLEGIEQLEPWATPFKEQMYRQMMLQNELIRSINSIDGIAASKVHLNLPSRSEFLRDEVRATASVTLRPDGGVLLTADTARSIARLVANAVNGMTPTDVTVLDVSDGRTLWGGEPEAGAGNQDMIKLTARREVELAEAVRTVLGRMLGTPDALTVTVSAELESASVQSTVQSIDPNTAIPVEEKLSTTINGATTTTAAGVPGTDANMPERQAAQGGTNQGGSRSEQQSTTYEFTRTTTTTSKPAGSIRRLSASVMINTDVLQAVLAKASADGKVDPAAEAALRADLEEAVRAALGYSSERGDQVVVKFTRFAEVELSEMEPVATAALVEQIADNSLLLLAMVLTFGIVIYPLMRYVLNNRLNPAAAPGEAMAAAATGTNTTAANAPMPASAESTDDLARRLRAAVENFESLSAQDLSELVSRESEHSAEVLRRWIRG
jgi:flagellar M-ring protein FliF